MAINIDFDKEQTARLVDAIESGIYAYVFATGYMAHAQHLVEKEKLDNPVREGSYALNAKFPDTVKQILELDQEELTKLLTSTIKAAQSSFPFDSTLAGLSTGRKQ